MDFFRCIYIAAEQSKAKSVEWPQCRQRFLNQGYTEDQMEDDLGSRGLQSLQVQLVLLSVHTVDRIQRHQCSLCTCFGNSMILLICYRSTKFQVK